MAPSGKTRQGGGLDKSRIGPVGHDAPGGHRTSRLAAGLRRGPVAKFQRRLAGRPKPPTRAVRSLARGILGAGPVGSDDAHCKARGKLPEGNALTIKPTVQRRAGGEKLGKPIFGDFLRGGEMRDDSSSSSSVFGTRRENSGHVVCMCQRTCGTAVLWPRAPSRGAVRNGGYQAHAGCVIFAGAS